MLGALWEPRIISIFIWAENKTFAQKSSHCNALYFASNEILRCISWDYTKGWTRRDTIERKTSIRSHLTVALHRLRGSADIPSSRACVSECVSALLTLFACINEYFVFLVYSLEPWVSTRLSIVRSWGSGTTVAYHIHKCNYSTWTLNRIESNELKEEERRERERKKTAKLLRPTHAASGITLLCSYFVHECMFLIRILFRSIFVFFFLSSVRFCRSARNAFARIIFLFLRFCIDLYSLVPVSFFWMDWMIWSCFFEWCAA